MGTVSFPVYVTYSFLPTITFGFYFELNFDVLTHLSGQVIQGNPLVYQQENRVDTSIWGNVFSYIELYPGFNVGVYSCGTLMNIANIPRITVTNTGGMMYNIKAEWFLVIFDFEGTWGTYVEYLGVFYPRSTWTITGIYGVHTIYENQVTFD